MRIWIAALVCLAAASGFCAQGPNVSVGPEWQDSSLHGPGGSITKWTEKTGSQIGWQPGFTAPVWADVSFYKLVYVDKNDSQVQLQIVHAEGTNTVYVDCSTGESEWENLGTYRFAGTPREGVFLERISSGHTTTRAAGVRFDLHSHGADSAIIQSLTLDVQGEQADVPDWIGKRPGVPGPPRSAEWELTFRDEFDGTSLNSNVWKSDASAPGHILSSRWPENVIVENGTLRLLAKKEQRAGREWTTGSIWTRSFKQQYGYFECRMRIAAASGLNNAFWLMTQNKTTDPIHFEIDITEAHYPVRHMMNIHQWAGEHFANGKGWISPVDLSADYHLYALEWNAEEMIWYFDGIEVRREPNEFCHDRATVYVSLAVGSWAGKITDAIDGTSQDVDWVRGYKKKETAE